MPIETACSSCSAKIKIKDELIGKSIKCPKCGKVSKTGAAANHKKTVPKPPPAPWDTAEDEEKAAPWEKKAPAKKNAKKKGEDDEDDETPKSKKTKAPPKRKKNAVDDDDDPGEKAFNELLAETQLPDVTKQIVKKELGLRENGVWVGQPCPKIMTVRAIPKGLFGVFFVTILFGGLGGGFAGPLGENWYFAAIPAALGWVLFAPVMMIGVPLMDRRKAYATAYVITNKRCIVFTGRWFGAPIQESFYPDLLAHMRNMPSWIFQDNAGDLVFRSLTTITTTHHRRGGTSRSVQTTYYGFLGLRRMDEVEELIRKTLLRDNDDDDDDDDD